MRVNMPSFFKNNSKIVLLDPSTFSQPASPPTPSTFYSRSSTISRFLKELLCLISFILHFTLISSLWTWPLSFLSNPSENSKGLNSYKDNEYFFQLFLSYFSDIYKIGYLHYFQYLIKPSVSQLSMFSQVWLFF